MIGQTLGSYRIVEQVGMGGMATVYKAYDPGTDRYVAIKILPAHYSQDPTFRERFRREAKAIARLEHPHILPIHAYGEEGDTAYLLMRFLPTGTLKQRIERGALPYGEASAMLTQIADGLDYAHKRGILHRDIKPSNILLDESGNAYLSDFGIARMIGSAGDLTGTGMLGTPAYMSPEQCAGSRDLSPASDQYALGVVLYEMVTGRTPFQAETPLALIQMHLSAPLPPPHLLRPDLPEAVEGVILKALSRSPQDRWTTCSEMADAFNRAIGESGIAAYTPPMRSGETTAEGVELTFGETMPAPPPTVRAAKRGVPMWMLGLAGMLVIGLVVGGLAVAGVLGGALSGEPVSDHEATLTMNAGTAQSMAGTAGVQSANRTATVAAGGPTETPAPTATLSPLDLGEWLDFCGSDLCFFDNQGNQTPTNIARDFILFNGSGQQFSLSPDGARIVFSGCAVAELGASAECRGDIFVANRDGNNPVHLYGTADFYELRPSWSPDGEEIVFNEGWNIWSIRPEGTGLKQIAFGEMIAESYYYAWSPDSQQIAWASGRHKDNGAPDWDRLYVMNRDGSGLRTLLYSADPFLSGEVAWSPDGQSLAVGFVDGNTYLFDATCDAAPGGCDRAAATALDEIPKHWQNVFTPQWAGEPEAEAIIAGCQTGEQVLYREDFENPAAVTQVASWSVSEAPGGGLSLHGIADGQFANYPLIASSVTESRIRFRVMPVTDSWLVNFRDSSTQASGQVRYDFIQFRDRSRLTRWDNESWFDLVSSAPLPVNEWSVIEIAWEAANIVVVRVDDVEHARYVETSSPYAQGSISLWLASQYSDANAEAWFDDIVICGPYTVSVAPDGTPSSAGEAFAAPILAAIADRPPDFEDDFSTTSKGWQIYDPNIHIGDSVLRINLPEGQTYGSLTNAQMWAADFVYQVDVKAITLERNSSIQILLREGIPLNYSVSLFPQSDGQWRIYDHVDNAEIDGGSAPDLIPMGQWITIVVVAKGSEFAIYSNGQLLVYFVDDTIPEGLNKLGAGGPAGGRIDVEFDNLKFWNLANVSGLP